MLHFAALLKGLWLNLIGHFVRLGMTTLGTRTYRGLVFATVSAAMLGSLSVPVTASVGRYSMGDTIPQPSGQGSWKAAHDTDPHLAIVNGPHHQSRNKSQGRMSALTIPSDAVIGENQQGQQTSYWCGPAAESEAVGLVGLSYSQSSEASALNTTTSGTAWSGVNANVPAGFQTGYPMRDVFNYEYYNYAGFSPGYAVVAVPYTPSGTDTNNYISNMTWDISNGWPVIGDAWEVAGYPHLTNHPGNQTIYHWFTIIGYYNYGSQTAYEDSATTVWSSVPAYTLNFDTPTLVGILGGRGYIW